MDESRKQIKRSFCTVEAVDRAVREAARREGRSYSDMVHRAISGYFGFTPQGERTTATPMPEQHRP